MKTNNIVYLTMWVVIFVSALASHIKYLTFNTRAPKIAGPCLVSRRRHDFKYIQI